MFLIGAYWIFENDNKFLLFLALAVRISFKRPSFSLLPSVIRKMGLWDSKAKINEPKLKFFFKAIIKLYGHCLNFFFKELESEC